MINTLLSLLSIATLFWLIFCIICLIGDIYKHRVNRIHNRNTFAGAVAVLFLIAAFWINSL